MIIMKPEGEWVRVMIHQEGTQKAFLLHTNADTYHCTSCILSSHTIAGSRRNATAIDHWLQALPIIL